MGVWPEFSAWPLAPFLGTPALWFDGRQPMFSDIAGTVPANIGAPLGRINEPAPLVSNWVAPSVGQRPRCDAQGARIEYFGTPASQQLQHASTPSINTIDCTLAIAFRPRDALAGPAAGFLRAGAFGLWAGGRTLHATHSNGSLNWSPAVPDMAAGMHVVFIVRYTATGLAAWVMYDGVLYKDTLVSAITGGASAIQYTIGDETGADQGMYGSVGQALVFSSALSDSNCSALANWMSAQPVPAAFTSSSPLFAVCGDSIARSVPGAVIYNAWCWSALSNIRGTYPTCEMYNAAVGGAGAANVINNALPYYSPTRARNVMTISVGTNDLATGSSAATLLATLFAQYDTALSFGWRPVIATILDRTGALSVSQATYDANRATVNAGILASGRRIADLTGIAGISANGSSAGANFIGDGVHPGDAGHQLMEPVMRAAMLAAAT